VRLASDLFRRGPLPAVEREAVTELPLLLDEHELRFGHRSAARLDRIEQLGGDLRVVEAVHLTPIPRSNARARIHARSPSVVVPGSGHGKKNAHPQR
jgi:hypothetical protein